MANGLLQQAVAQETAGVQQAGQDQQNMYNVFVKTCRLIADKTMPALKERLQTGSPVDGIAQVGVMVINRALDQLAQIGVQVPEDIIYQGGLEVLGYLHEELGLSLTQPEIKLAAEKAVDLYLSQQEQNETLDMEGIGQVAQALKQDKLQLEGA